MSQHKDCVILLVEDDAPQRKTLAGFLKKHNYAVLEAESADEARALAEKCAIDLLLTDLRLGGPDGIELVNTLKAEHPDMQALVLTAFATVDDAIRAIKAGAYDFLSKPIDLDRLEILVEKALDKVQLSRENRSLREVVKTSGAFSELIGECESMRKIKELAMKVASSRASVIILGESGTGKEVLARSIHLASPRKSKPFFSLSCAALPETLIESELFGHEKGAFTGASFEKKGRFELSDGGTLFLDEVGDIPLALQVKLLQVLQSGCFERLGSSHTRKVDVRILAATHRNLEQWIGEGRFRADLFYRLNVVSIVLPPLRERPEDIPLLVAHFVQKQAALSGSKISSVDPEVMDALMRYDFPGNVRELENWIERAMVLADGERLVKEDFPPQLFEPQQSEGNASINIEEATGNGSARAGGLEDQVARLETALIQEALLLHHFNKSAAARELGITERSIRYKIKKYNL